MTEFDLITKTHIISRILTSSSHHTHTHTHINTSVPSSLQCLHLPAQQDMKKLEKSVTRGAGLAVHGYCKAACLHFVNRFQFDTISCVCVLLAALQRRGMWKASATEWRPHVAEREVRRGADRLPQRKQSVIAEYGCFCFQSR